MTEEIIREIMAHAVARWLARKARARWAIAHPEDAKRIRPQYPPKRDWPENHCRLCGHGPLGYIGRSKKLRQFCNRVHQTTWMAHRFTKAQRSARGRWMNAQRTPESRRGAALKGALKRSAIHRQIIARAGGIAKAEAARARQV